MAPFFIQIGGRFLSTIVTISPGVYLFYFPYITGVPMALWWGPRVFVAVFVASALGAHLAGVGGLLTFFLALSETSKVAIGWAMWWLLKFHQRDLRSTKQLFMCWLSCFAVPNIFGSYAVVAVLTLQGVYPQNTFWFQYLKVSLIDTAMGLFISFPLFIFLNHIFVQKGWSQWRKSLFH